MMWSPKGWWPVALLVVSAHPTDPEPRRPAPAVPGPPPAAGAHAAAFSFGAAASDRLTRLWSESVEARAERVACIGGERHDGIALVTRVRVLGASGADLANIPATSSLEECRPPVWFGTVHTHIATFQGIPYTTFSPPDRDVIARWNKRWRTDGVFCVLYSETGAHCEVGNYATDDMAYSTIATPRIVLQRGNIIGATH